MGERGEREKDRKRVSERDKETEREIERDTHRQTNRQTKRHRSNGSKNVSEQKSVRWWKEVDEGKSGQSERWKEGRKEGGTRGAV